MYLCTYTHTVIILVVEHVQFARLAAKAFKEDISRKLWCVCVVVVVVVVVCVCVCVCVCMCVCVCVRIWYVYGEGALLCIG